MKTGYPTFQKRLSGSICRFDLRGKTLSVRFQKWWEEGSGRNAHVTFLLDPYAVITRTDHDMLKLAELSVGRWVTVTYVTSQGGQQVAKSITVSGKPVCSGGSVEVRNEGRHATTGGESWHDARGVSGSCAGL